MAKIIKEGLTFDDVLLIPQKSEILPKEIDTKTHLTKSIELNIPITEVYNKINMSLEKEISKILLT